ncbi:hypothetical protein DL1_11810 [Thioclava dalianensis]|uniref:Uncharacterized protein n=1 Tax=Thioclava dalianensis TaxID=1185766 RepID=A0A074TE28_9RHOB|nr:hypothetical protein [Thioclava dalianensis]KEP68425.1 hypothetical protein DL1_11810 [Thioclava dalianensis]SFN61920.1 hypothetical protein SAMN05216224_10826 [Thioclava dalianensis]
MSTKRIRDQFLRDEIAKAERQDVEFLSAQQAINSRQMRRDTAHSRRTNIIIAVTALAAIALLAHLRGWI